MKRQVFSALALALASAGSAHEYKVGSVHIDHPVIRVASPASKTGAGFMTISNRGGAADRLLRDFVLLEDAAAPRPEIQNVKSVQWRTGTPPIRPV